MQKRNLFIILSVVTIFFIFSTFIFTGCKGCGAEDIDKKVQEVKGEVITNTSEEAEEDSPQKKATIEETEKEITEAEAEEEPEEEAEAEEEEVSEEEIEGEAPTISLAIYEGPTLDGSICYYRVETTVAGSPTPTVSFSKDDSGGAWGPRKAQVNLNDPTDTYTLTATATNSEGSATDTIELNWGCEVQEEEPDSQEPDTQISSDVNLSPVRTVYINLHPSNSGYIIMDHVVVTGMHYLMVGDWDTNRLIKGYLSFDISNISAIDNITIGDIFVTIPVSLIENHPELASPDIKVKVYYYGDTLDYPVDQGLGGVLVGTIPTSASLDNMIFTSVKLIDELQKAVDADRQWFQLKMVFSTISADNNQDWYRIPKDGVVFFVSYMISG